MAQNRRPIPARDPREDKLPRWAQDQLAQLRRQVADAQRGEDAARQDTKPEESDAVLDYYDADPIGLGVGQAVTFLLGEVGDSRGLHIHARVQRPQGRTGPLPAYLELMAGDDIVIRSQSGNVVKVQDGGR